MKKNEKGITLIALIITIIIILILIGATVVGSGILERASIQAVGSDMLLIQTKVKIINEKVAFNGDTSIYVGKKLKTEPNKEKIAGNSLSKEELERDSYYIYDRETLDSIGLEGIQLKKGQVYIVNYTDGEIIWPEGVKNDKGETIYRLSEIAKDSLIKGDYEDDKVGPILAEPNWKIGINSITLGVIAVDEYSGIDGYQFFIDGERQWGPEGNEWEKSNVYTFNGLTEDTEYIIYYKVTDRAGNVVTSEEYKIRTLKLEVDTLTMKLENSSGSIYTPDTWSAKNVYLYYANNINHTKYRVEGAMTIPEREEPVVLTEEGTYHVYQKVENGKDILESGPIVVKIDKTAPNIPNITEPQSYTVEEGNKEVTITATSISDTTSGIKSAVWYVAVPEASYGSGIDVTTEVQENGTATLHYTLNTEGAFRFKIVVTDNANNQNFKETTVTLGRHVHSYINWTMISDTVHRGTCSCGETQDQTHSWGSWVQTTAATCTAAGTQTATCPICNGTKTQRLPAALGHTGQTHANGGKCTRCGVTYVTHTWGSWSQTTAATCTAAGTQTRTCSCGTKGTQSAPAALGHTGQTHANGGKCTRCGTTYVTHSWGGWTTTVAATCGTAGTQVRTCSCGTKESATIAATGNHNMQATGNTINVYSHETKCTVCGLGGTANHTPGSAWSKGSNNHGKQCTVCKHITYQNYGAHSYTTSGSGARCSVCGYIKP